MVQNGQKWDLGRPLGPKSGPRPKKEPKRSSFGLLLASKMVQKCSKNDPEKGKKKEGRKRRPRAPFWTILGAILEPKVVKNGLKNKLKTGHVPERLLG